LAQDTFDPREDLVLPGICDARLCFLGDLTFEVGDEEAKSEVNDHLNDDTSRKAED
jgi:hypothetical protein